MNKQTRYSPEVRERAVRLVFEHQGEHGSQWAAIGSIAEKMGCTAETLRKWVRQAERDQGKRAGLSGAAQGTGAGEPRAEAGKRDPAQGLGVFCPGGARPPSEVMMSFIDAHRAAYRVEPICAQLPIAPSVYYEYKARQTQPERMSARARRDVELTNKIQRVHAQNLHVYGARKVWKQLNREGLEVARCTVERLMRALGLRGVRRGRCCKTTVPDIESQRPADRVNRQFIATQVLVPRTRPEAGRSTDATRQ